MWGEGQRFSSSLPSTKPPPNPCMGRGCRACGPTIPCQKEWWHRRFACAKNRRPRDTKFGFLNMIEWKLWLKNFLDAIKLPKKYIFWLFMLSGIFLFLLFKEKEWLVYIELDVIITQYKQYIILIFLGLGLLILIECSINIFKRINDFISKKYRLIKIRRKIGSLSADEKSILREFFLEQKSSIRLPINDKSVKNLLKTNVLTKDESDYGEMSVVGKLYAMSISEEAEPLIRPALIDWPKDRSRPWFVEVIEKTKKKTTWMSL